MSHPTAQIVSDRVTLPGRVLPESLIWLPRLRIFFGLTREGARVPVPQGWALSVALREARKRAGEAKTVEARCYATLTLQSAEAATQEAIGHYDRAEAKTQTAIDAGMNAWCKARRAADVAMREFARIP